MASSGALQDLEEIICKQTISPHFDQIWPDQEDIGKLWKIMENIRKYQKITENLGKYHKLEKFEFVEKNSSLGKIIRVWEKLFEFGKNISSL